jgi:hypothetical protein
MLELAYPKGHLTTSHTRVDMGNPCLIVNDWGQVCYEQTESVDVFRSAP